MQKLQGKLPLKQDAQPALFSKYASMTLLDMWKECGRIRRLMYGKQMAEERKQALVKLNKAEELPK